MTKNIRHRGQTRGRCSCTEYLEKLAAAARVIQNDEQGASEQVRAWHMHLLNSSRAAERILTVLRDSGNEHARIGEQRPVHEAITYLENNAARMDYATARRRGLPIGSGAVEATCKSLMAHRLKRSGARWHTDTGEHIVQLRAHLISDRWEPLMRTILEPMAVAVTRVA